MLREFRPCPRVVRKYPGIFFIAWFEYSLESRQCLGPELMEELAVRSLVENSRPPYGDGEPVFQAIYARKPPGAKWLSL